MVDTSIERHIARCLRIPSTARGLRDFIERGERDLAGAPNGLCATYPEFRRDAERAVRTAKLDLACLTAGCAQGPSARSRSTTAC